MFGGFENKWEDKDGNIITDTIFLNTKILFVFRFGFLRATTSQKTRVQRPANGIKYTLKFLCRQWEVNTKGQVIFHPMFYLNWDKPIVFKK
ncbi:MAG: hypothetical protein R2777_09005 [Chitinophagales bacterium]